MVVHKYVSGYFLGQLFCGSFKSLNIGELTFYLIHCGWTPGINLVEKNSRTRVDASSQQTVPALWAHTTAVFSSVTSGKRRFWLGCFCFFSGCIQEVGCTPLERWRDGRIVTRSSWWGQILTFFISFILFSDEGSRDHSPPRPLAANPAQIKLALGCSWFGENAAKTTVCPSSLFLPLGPWGAVSYWDVWTS